jgi:hypothetical protein
MVKCTFCGHDNLSGRFCEQCKTDLTVLNPSEATAVGDEVPYSLPAPKSDLEVPTLHFERIPLVETLKYNGEVTRTPAPEKPPPTPIVAVSPAAADVLELGKSARKGSASGTSGEQAPAIKPHLLVIRGELVNVQYTLYPGKNYLGRTDDKPVDIDLENQEPADRIWTSRQHAVITFEKTELTIEDLNSLNGTFVNRTRVHPGQVRALQANDIIQVGTVQLRLIIG